MEHNDFQNHRYFNVHARNTLQVYNNKSNHIIQLGDKLDETEEINDNNEPKQSTKKKKKIKVNYDDQSVLKPTKEISNMYIAQRNGVEMGSIPKSYHVSCVSSYIRSLKCTRKLMTRYVDIGNGFISGIFM